MVVTIFSFFTALVVTFGYARGELDPYYCAIAKCPFEPKNALQLQYCGMAGKLKGHDIQNLFTCQDVTDPAKCATTQTQEGCI